MKAMSRSSVATVWLPLEFRVKQLVHSPIIHLLGASLQSTVRVSTAFQSQQISHNLVYAAWLLALQPSHPI